ncbi:restriction endonuclease subunit S [Anaerobutyricum hallii]|nr:restriction endonuclease subunit S [Anaerobutyricum hallii]
MLMLTDICTDSPDYGFSASGKVAGRYRFARITDIDPLGRLKKNDAKFVDSDGGKILKENDVMIARTGTQVGKAYLYDPKDGELVFASFLIRFHLDPKKVVPAFIKYYMLSNAYKKWAEKTSSGSTRNGLNIETLSKMPVPELTTEKQKEIVRILDSLYHALSIQEDMISLLEQYVQDVFDYKSRELQFKGKLKELFILRTENKQNEEGELSPFSILVVFLSMQERLLMSKKV